MNQDPCYRIPAWTIGGTRAIRASSTARISPVYLPIAQIFVDAQGRGEVQPHEPGMLAAAAIALIDSIRTYNVSEDITGPPELLGDRLIDVLLDGVWV